MSPNKKNQNSPESRRSRQNSFWTWIFEKFGQICVCASSSQQENGLEPSVTWLQGGSDQLKGNLEDSIKLEDSSSHRDNFENGLFPPKNHKTGDEPLHGRDSGFGEEDGHEVIASMAPRDCYDRETVLKQIEEAVSKIKKSHYLTTVLEKIGSTLLVTLDRSKGSSSVSSCLKKIEVILCYELGSLSSTNNYNSVHQFAFLLSIQKMLKIPLQFCDPLFTPLDKLIVSQNYEFQIIPWSDRIERQKNVKELTLFYVPATTYGIINSILESNWNPKNLPNVMVVTVSFRGITRDLREAPVGFFDPIDCTFIKRACNVVIERKLNVSSQRYNAAVSCFSVHTFPSSRLRGLDTVFWRVDHGWREF